MKNKPCKLGDKCYVIDHRNLILETVVDDLVYSAKNDEWTIVEKLLGHDTGAPFLNLDEACAVREKKLIIDKVARLLYRRQNELLPKFLGREEACCYGGVQTLKKNLDYKFQVMSYEELKTFYEANKGRSKR